MKAEWKDYRYGSWLVLVFGTIAAKIVEVGWTDTGVPNHFGILLFPGNPFQLLPGSGPGGADPTLDQAKVAAETVLWATLTQAIESWPVRKA